MGLVARLISMALLGRKNGYRQRAFRRFDPCRRSGSSRDATAGHEPPTPPPPPRAADGWVDVAGTGELPAGRVLEARVAGRPVAVANVDGVLFAVDGTCLHAGGPLGDGSLEGGVLTCPYHGWTYDVTTGRCQVDEALCLVRYSVRSEAGRILVSEAPLSA